MMDKIFGRIIPLFAVSPHSMYLTYRPPQHNVGFRRTMPCHLWQGHLMSAGIFQYGSPQHCDIQCHRGTLLRCSAIVDQSDGYNEIYIIDMNGRFRVWEIASDKSNGLLEEKKITYLIRFFAK